MGRESRQELPLPGTKEGMSAPRLEAATLLHPPIQARSPRRAEICRLRCCKRYVRQTKVQSMAYYYRHRQWENKALLGRISARHRVQLLSCKVNEQATSNFLQHLPKKERLSFTPRERITSNTPQTTQKTSNKPHLQGAQIGGRISV